MFSYLTLNPNVFLINPKPKGFLLAVILESQECVLSLLLQSFMHSSVSDSLALILSLEYQCLTDKTNNGVLASVIQRCGREHVVCRDTHHVCMYAASQIILHRLAVIHDIILIIMAYYTVVTVLSSSFSLSSMC